MTDLLKPTIVLIHRAANSAAVSRYWQELLALHGWKTVAVNLRGHGGAWSVDLTAVTMEDYAADVGQVIAGLLAASADRQVGECPRARSSHFNEVSLPGVLCPSTP